MAREQDQFLDVVDRDTAERRWLEAIRPRVLGAERVALAMCLGRVLAADVITEVDVPAFDRSNVDGFALRAEETFGAAEETPRRFRLNSEELATGVVPRQVVGPGTATPIATGGMTPRGADAVVMVEHTTIDGDELLVRRPVAPGSGITFAGTDMARGELVLRRGTRLTSRETGVLAAIGRGEVEVIRRPSLKSMLPDYSVLFRRDTISPLHFRVRGGANFVHDIQFLSSYLHDGRFFPQAVTRRGKKLLVAVERDCWELDFTERPEALALHTAKSRLALGPVSSVRWETSDPACLERELQIESIYVGAAHWETPEVSEILISAPRGGWKLCICLADDFGDIRLDDLETPHLHPARRA